MLDAWSNRACYVAGNCSSSSFHPARGWLNPIDRRALGTKYLSPTILAQPGRPSSRDQFLGYYDITTQPLHWENLCLYIITYGGLWLRDCRRGGSGSSLGWGRHRAYYRTCNTANKPAHNSIDFDNENINHLQPHALQEGQLWSGRSPTSLEDSREMRNLLAVATAAGV